MKRCNSNYTSKTEEIVFFGCFNEENEAFFTVQKSTSATHRAT